ncbi:aminopeptidase P family protein [Mesorhizobium sp. M0203]|uniref:aminopeptidase P family protein n=1 Tax=Mesorhizobium sp. M0203 TaxID=2956912 RepID=UPI003339A3AA
MSLNTEIAVTEDDPHNALAARTREGGVDHVRDIQDWLAGSELAGLVIPSTDGFLSEFAPPAERRLRWATGFRGSTGEAVVLREAAALFLVGRYAQQGLADTRGAPLSIEPATLAARRAWLGEALPKNARIGLDPWLYSAADRAEWQSLADELGFFLEVLPESPVDRLWSKDMPSTFSPMAFDHPLSLAGASHAQKCATLAEHLRGQGLEALLVADPEDVSWLLNVRAADEALQTEVGDWHIVPACRSRALVERAGKVTWFVDRRQLAPALLSREVDGIAIMPPDKISEVLAATARRGPVGADLRRTPAALAAVIEANGSIRSDDTVAHNRWRKHAAEIEAARRAHIIDAAAVVRFMTWLAQTVPAQSVTEFEAAERLEALRRGYPQYKGPSMPLMSASGPSGAQPHYVPRREGCGRLNNHPIYWMDSGGQYPGATTDNTLTQVLGRPEPKHVLAHTLVLKGYVALATARFPAGIQGLRLDCIARQALWQEGMDYDHGTGHGVGAFLNIHEGPHIAPKAGVDSTTPIELGMLITNEPGYYAADDFGVRIKSHMVVVAASQAGFAGFDTISRLPIDPKLVDSSRLDAGERRWLADYHRTVLADVGPLLDPVSLEWLSGVAAAFAAAAEGV